MDFQENRSDIDSDPMFREWSHKISTLCTCVRYISTGRGTGKQIEEDLERTEGKYINQI